MEKWELSEELTARIYDGKRVPGSGSKDEKLDIICGGFWKGFRIENKWRSNSITLSKVSLKKIRRQAINMGVDHFLVLHYEDYPFDMRYVMLEESTFLRLCEAADDNLRFHSRSKEGKAPS